MAPATLMQSQANELFERVGAAGFDHTRFSWRDVQSSQLMGGLDASMLINQQDDMSFGVARHVDNLDRFRIMYMPGDVANFVEEVRLNWNQLLIHFGIWLQSGKREAESIDLWAEAQRQRELLDPQQAEGAENTFFSEAERAEISRTLREIKELLVANYELQGDPLALVEERLKYLEDAASRVGRIDWWNLLLSALFQFVARAVLSADAVQDAFGYAARALGGFFGGHGELPPNP